MSQPFPETFVLFVDMLGFAALVEAESEHLSDLSPIFTTNELYSPKAAESLLGYRFINFHACLESARRNLQEANAGTCVAFSDSAFFRVDTLDQALDLARSLMRELTLADVPARMGLAKGSFRMLRFVSDSSAQVSFHMAQFLGTGVVRAYKTERCGAPGLRILLHPDLNPMLQSSSIPVVELTDTPERMPVQFELNYLDEHVELQIEPTTKEDVSDHYSDVIIFDCVRRMTAYADEGVHYHYIATYNAYNQMRLQYGRSEYPWEKFEDRDNYMRNIGVWRKKSDGDDGS